MFQLPQIDLNAILPVLGLAAIAVVCIAALLLRSLLHSRVALLIAIVAGIVGGPALGGVLSQIINSLIGLALVLGAVAIAALAILHRNPDLRAMLRDVLPERQPPLPTPPLLPPGNQITVIDHPAQLARTRTPKSSGDNWGF